MHVLLTDSVCILYRDTGDRLAGKESTVVYWMKLALNRQGYNFVRMRPSRLGLTSCKLGLIDRKRGIVLWHERYAIENAATEYNRCKVVFMRQDQVRERKATA